jgi:hypothetical protein
LPTANDAGVGSYQPAVTDHKMAWVGFTAAGYQVNEANRKDLKWIDAGDIYTNSICRYGYSGNRKRFIGQYACRVVDKPLPVTNIQKLHGLFNFHSLIPNISDPNYSVAIVGENVLNTFSRRFLLIITPTKVIKSLALMPYTALCSRIYLPVPIIL